MPPRNTPFTKEMKSRGGIQGPSGFMQGMDPDLFDAYHGSSELGLKEITTPKDHGGGGVYSISKRDRTYFTDVAHTDDFQSSEHRAWRWAEGAANIVGGRPTVYRTQARGLVSEDTNLAQGEGAFTASHQIVRSEINTPPPSVFRRMTYSTGGVETPVGVQGTVPGVNWAQFGGAAAASKRGRTEDPMLANATPIWAGKRDTVRNDRPARDMGPFDEHAVKPIRGQQALKF